MAQVVPQRSVFGQKLRQELDAQGLSVRRLARRLSPEAPERMRRNLVRWIGGHNKPTAAHREAVADALGVSRDTFAADDDEEEDPLVALMKAVRRVVREEIERELGRA